MATPDATIRLGQVGLEKDIQRAIQKVNARGGLNVKLNARSFTQPLGKITASADEFTKSIEASNARVIAFGASVGVINSISNAFKSLVQETIALEKRLAEVNVVLGANASQLNTFGKQLFNVARNTAQSFDTVSEAALEFSRQGLSMEETLKRTQDALILTRLTGLKAADSVKGLTATINSFATAGLNTAEIISKLAAVDVEFAVSSEDLINALSRAGAVAQDAGLDFDQLVAAVTSAQQITARGGAVIGNSFKTIFTRIQRSDTLDRLQELGIAVRDVRGETLPAMMILQQLAKTYDSLTDSTKSAVAEQVGGVFQINVLKAALKDLSSENSIYQRAVVTSAGATDEAIRKNDQLNQTLSALSSQALVSIKELSAAVGQITVGPGIEKVLNMVNDLSQGAARLLDGEGIGSNLANGILKGLGTIISGPGLVLIGGLIGKLFIDVTTFAAKSFKNILGLNKAAVQQKALQDSILTTLQSNERINRVLEGLEGNKAAQAKFLFNEVSRTTTEYNKQVGLARQLASTLGQMGVVGGSAGLALSGKRGRSQVTSARGFIPNYANATAQEMMDIKLGVGGVSKSERPVTLKGFDTGKEIVDMVANTGEVFVKNFAGSGGDAIFNPDMIRSFGMPQGAKKIRGSRGFIPNYALTPWTTALDGFEKDELITKLENNEIDFSGYTSVADAIDSQVVQDAGYKEKDIKAFRKASSNVVLRNEQRKRAGTTSKGKRAVNLTFDGTPYGVVIPQAGENGSVNMSVPQSEIFDKVPFPRGSTITAKGVGVARLDKNSSYQEALKAEMTRAIDGIARSLLPGGSDANFKSTDFEKFLDKSAKPQFLGRTFELALQYVTQKTVDHLKGGERFDFKNGLPIRIDEVFGLQGKADAQKKWDAKISATSTPSQKSMLEKIMLEEYGLASKRGLASKVIKDKSRQKTAAQGFLPNISIRASDLPALQDSIGREKAAGIPNFAIRVNRSPRLKSSGNPSGLAVTNVIDEPGGLKDVFRQKRVMSAAGGFVPNFALPSGRLESTKDALNLGKLKKEAEQLEQQLADINQTLSQNQTDLDAASAAAAQANEEYDKQSQLLQEANSKIESEQQKISNAAEERAKLSEESAKLKKEIVKEEKRIRATATNAAKSDKKLEALKKERRVISARMGMETKKQNASNAQITIQQNQIRTINNDILKAEQENLKQVRNREDIERQINDNKKRQATLSSRGDTVGRRVSSGRKVLSAVGEGLMGAAAFAGPMLLAGIQDAMFKGMERAEMSREQRATQGALQGAQEGVAISGMIAMFVPGGPFIKAITVLASTGVAAFLGMQKAAELSFDEIKASLSKFGQEQASDATIGQDILRRRRALEDPSLSQADINENKKAIQEAIKSISSVQFRETLANNFGDLTQLEQAVNEFSQQSNSFNKTNEELSEDLLKSAQQFKKDAAGGDQNFVKNLSGLLLTFDKDVRENLRKNIKNITENGEFKEFREVTTMTVDTRSGPPRKSVTSLVTDAGTKAAGILRIQLLEGVKAAAGNNKEVEERLKDALTKVTETLVPELKITNKKGNKNELNTEEGAENLLNAIKLLNEALANSTPVVDKVSTEVDNLTDKLTQYNNIIAGINEQFSKSLNEIQSQIRTESFNIKLAGKIENFRNSIVGNLFDNRVERLRFQNQSINAQQGVDLKKFSAERAEEFRKIINDNFGRADDAVKLGGEIIQQFFKDPRKAIEDALKISGGPTAIGSDPDDDRFAAAQSFEQQEGLEQTKEQLRLLKNQIDIIDETAARQKLNAIVANEIERVKLKNATAVGRAQDELFSKTLALQKELQGVELELQKSLDKIDLRLSDPLNRRGGRAGIQQQTDANIERLRLQRDAIDERGKIERRIAIEQATANVQLITATGLNSKALEANTSILSEQATIEVLLIRTLNSLPERIANAVKGIPGTKGPAGAAGQAGGDLPTVGDQASSGDVKTIAQVDIPESIIVGRAEKSLKSIRNLVVNNQKSSKAIAELQDELAKVRGSDSDTLENVRKILARRQLNPGVREQVLSQFRPILSADQQREGEKSKIDAQIENERAKGQQNLDALLFEAGTSAFGEGLETEIDGFAFKLGNEVPSAFKDGMTNALSAIVNQTDNLGDTLLGIANSFLQTIQQAFLQQASSQFVQQLGFTGFATGGYVGNGSRVPAMLTNGEYVMSREAVQRLGTGGMDQLNKGTLSMAGFANGGQVSNKARNAYGKHINTFGSSFDDSKSARFFGEFYDSVPKATRELSLQAAAEQETQAEMQAKQAKKKQLMSTIIGLAASAALAFGMSKIGKGVKANKIASGEFVKMKSGAEVALQDGIFVGKGKLNPTQQARIGELNELRMAGFGSGMNDKEFAKSAMDAGYFSKGGPVKGYAGGGQVRGPAGRDVIPAVLTEGEYVIKASSARKYGKRFLDNLNYGSQGYYNGGATGPMPVGGSQNFNLNMNFDVASGQTESQQGQGQSNGQKGQDQNINQFAQNIRKLVQEEIQKEQRAGGLLRGTRR